MKIESKSGSEAEQWAGQANPHQPVLLPRVKNLRASPTQGNIKALSHPLHTFKVSDQETTVTKKIVAGSFYKD